MSSCSKIKPSFLSKRIHLSKNPSIRRDSLQFLAIPKGNRVTKWRSSKWIIIACFFALFCSGCNHNFQDDKMTQLQIREIQTRTFASTNAKQVLKEMINVMQDDAFIVKNANAELGFVTGEKDIDVENGWNRVMSIFVGGNNTAWKKNQVIEISANVTQFGNDTRVRVNIQRKLFDNFGRVINVTQVYDSNYYQEFFDKVHKGLFIQQEQI